MNQPHVELPSFRSSILPFPQHVRKPLDINLFYCLNGTTSDKEQFMYRHTQTGYLIIVVFGAILLFIIGRIPAHGLEPRGFALLGILPVCLLLFSSLTIEIRDGLLKWKFGVGVIRKKVLLTDIINATPIRTTFLQGWGIHRTRGGWLYNVSGFQAVEFQMKDGKRFKLGTDEPEELVRAVWMQIRH